MSLSDLWAVRSLWPPCDFSASELSLQVRWGTGLSLRLNTQCVPETVLGALSSFKKKIILLITIVLRYYYAHLTELASEAQ